ncbi:helix-turn-helix transcriptional regulator [Corynebacterium kalidii]
MRRERAVRQDRLVDTAERAGISAQYLSELERGLKDPSSEVLEAVAGALGKSSFDLVRSAAAPTGPVLLAA